MISEEKHSGRNVLRNALYGLSTWALPLGLSFVATPIIVGALGNEDYGIYALVLGIIGYSFNFNFGKAITKYVAEYRASGAYGKINGTITASLILNLTIGSAGTLLLCLLAGWLVRDVFVISAPSQPKIIYGIYLAAAIIFVTMLNQLFNSILQGLHRFDLFSRLYNVNIILLLSGNALLALAGYGILELLGWNLLIITLTTTVNGYVCKRLLPEFRFEFSRGSGALGTIVRFSAGIIGCQVLSNVLLLFERGWLVRRFGSEELTYYVVPMMLAVSIHSFIASLMLMIFPLVSELAGDTERLKKLYQQGVKAALLLVSFIVFSGFALGRDFLTLWMGAEFADSATVLFLIQIVAFGLIAVEVVSWQMAEGLGYPSYNFVFIVVLLAVSAPLMVLLGESYGSEGVAVGRLAGSFCLFLSIFFIERRFLNGIDLGFWARGLFVFIIAGALAGALEYGLIVYLPVTWMTIVLVTFVAGVGYLGILWFAGTFTEKEIMLAKSLFAR